MHFFLLKLLTIVAVSTAIEAASISVVANGTEVNVGSSIVFKGEVQDVGNSTLSWIIGNEYVANATASVTSGTASISIVVFNNSMADNATFIPSGTNISTTLTLKPTDLTLNGSMVKLTDGTTESNVNTLIITVNCGTPPERAISTCTSFGCEASLQTSDMTSVAGKYKDCTTTYKCSGNGNWIQSNSTCTPLICSGGGKWGENCTKNCSSGCPGVLVKTCFADGRCADPMYKMSACAQGYTGAYCNETTTAEPTTQEASTTLSETTRKTETASASQEATAAPQEGTAAPAAPSGTTDAAPVETTTAPTILSECNAVPTTSCTKSQTMNLKTNCSVGGLEIICNTRYECIEDGKWNKIGNTTCERFCSVVGTWGRNCTNACSLGCRVGNKTAQCNVDTGRCINPVTMAQKDDCAAGYKGLNCEIPICDEDCSPGVCLAPNYCANCGKHYESGRRCRNIRLDGFVKGSLPSLAILAVILILLSLGSKWYIRNKIKEE